MATGKTPERIGIYGGTYDPIHLGHMAAARAAAEALQLDCLLLIPAGIPPHKQLSGAAATAEHRLRMTELAANRLRLKIPVKVLDLEICRQGKSYTSDTLQALRAQYPEEELWLLMGTDMFLSFHTWHQPEVIASLAGICAFARHTGDSSVFPARKAELEQLYPGCRVQLMEIPDLVEISSTRIRHELAQGSQPEALDESIYGYILRHGLYGVEADLHHLTWAQLRAASYSMIKAKRIPHVRGIEGEAVRLAERWGADPVRARTAAILHDCTKYLNLKEQLQLCHKYGILLDETEATTLKLLHAKTGAAIARDLFGVDEAVYQAILWHTTGKADMTLLEKVIYIADYMEPSRDFDGVEQLRALVYQDLDAAVLLGLEMTVVEMQQLGSPVHTRTLEAIRWLKHSDSRQSPED